jgi:ribosomal protein L11 methyltransferase
MSWIEVRARIPGDYRDRSPFVDAFREHGVENTLETGAEVVGCLPDVEGAAFRAQRLAEALWDRGAEDVAMRAFEEENWEEAWKRFFRPRRVGRRFLVRPSWEPPSEADDLLEIVLDPGQAFGTGDHATTRLCLELMEDAICPGARVADVGCGSGILSVGAKLLGAATVRAVDIEPVSVEVALENARRNDVQIEAVAGDGFDELGEDRYDAILSNIISATLVRIAPDALRRLVDGGHWIVSGVIPQNWPDVEAAASRAGFRLEDRLEEDGWVAARFVR